MALGAVPEVTLDLLEQGRREASQPLLRPELEDAVRLEPRLLRALPVTGCCRRLEPVERRRDDVEVGRLRRFLPLGRVEVGDQRERVLGRRLDRGRVGDRVAAGCVRERGAELVERQAQPPGGSSVASSEARRDRGTLPPRRRGTSPPPGSRSPASRGRPARRVRTRSARAGETGRAGRPGARSPPASAERPGTPRARARRRKAGLRSSPAVRGLRQVLERRGHPALGADPFAARYAGAMICQ